MKSMLAIIDHDSNNEDDLIIKKALEILGRRVTDNHIMDNPENAKNFIRLYFSKMTVECFGVFLLDSNLKLIDAIEISKGTVGHATVYRRELVKLVLDKNASNIILTHNHPDGDVSPSDEDVDLTCELMKAMFAIDVSILDHLIAGHDKVFSFSESGLIRDCLNSL